MTCFIYISESEKILCQKRRKAGQTAQWPRHQLCQCVSLVEPGVAAHLCNTSAPVARWEEPHQFKCQLAWCTGQPRREPVSGKVEGVVVGGIPAGCGWAAKVGARPLMTAGFSCQTAIIL